MLVMYRINHIYTNRCNAFISLLCLLWFFLGERVTCVWNVFGCGHLLYIFSHANFFHLLANICVCLSFKKSINVIAFITAVLISFFPMSDTPTLGMSALLFAHLGTTWAPSRLFKTMCKRILPFAILIGLLPSINLLIHIYALFVGYFLMLLYCKYFKK